jgi:hypothetical protein
LIERKQFGEKKSKKSFLKLGFEKKFEVAFTKDMVAILKTPYDNLTIILKPGLCFTKQG